MAHFGLRRLFATFAAPAMLAALVAGCASAPPELAVTAETRCTARHTNVYYEPWRPKPSHEALRQLHSFQTSFAGCRIDHVRIVGMADATGGDAANEALSEKRAKLIADELELGGWSAAKFEVVAIGEQGATVDGVDKPMRRRTRVEVQASVP